MMEEDRVVCIRFGHDWDEQCMVMDETLYQVQAKVQNFAVIYLGECCHLTFFRGMRLLMRFACSGYHQSSGFQ